jgi:hypothetical protein
MKVQTRLDRLVTMVNKLVERPVDRLLARVVRE